MVHSSVKAMQTYGQRLGVVGVDGKDGTITAAVPQQLAKNGEMALQQVAYDYFSGKTVEETINSPIYLVDKFSANQYA